MRPGSTGADTGPAAGLPLSCHPFSLAPASGTVGGYGRVALTIGFCPTVAQPVARNLVVAYRSPLHRKLQIPPSQLRLEGVGERPIAARSCHHTRPTSSEPLTGHRMARSCASTERASHDRACAQAANCPSSWSAR